MGTQIIRCSCKHPYQDSLYGVGNRIGNEQRTGMIRCTVCGTVGGTKSTFVKPVTAAAPAPVEKKEEKKKDSGKAERKSSKFKEKKKPSSKDAPKGEISKKKSMKGGKKK